MFPVSATILISTRTIFVYMILTKMGMIIVHEIWVMKTLVSPTDQARGYRTFFMLNSTEHEISTAGS